MALKNTINRYGSIAKGFHWVIALTIISLLIVGFIMVGMPTAPDKFKLYGLHKSFGITVLILACLRILWKAINIAPPLPVTLPKIEKLLAHAGHAFLYVLMFAMPLSGWAMSSASGFKVAVFGLFILPDLVAADPELKRTLLQAHETIAWLLIVMISLHALAALLHHLYYKNNVLRRMMPFMKG